MDKRKFLVAKSSIWLSTIQRFFDKTKLIL